MKLACRLFGHHWQTCAERWPMVRVTCSNHWRTCKRCRAVER